MDIIFIEQLSVITKIGIHKLGKRNQSKINTKILKIGYEINQQFLINKNKYFLDYEQITNEIINYIETNKFDLVEQVAEEVVNLLVNKFKISWIRIKIAKQYAIINASKVGVIIERGNKY
ncbi:Dihydroneopterin aldolase [Candidatus Providencia siddallii]|uniref:dihydroneopterin aldolase n=1 Tax=Candidatus Providencia siddallii TaxID=1715285 RepID=A0A0M6W947_9GAMM|nr:Dihydroneopterin aldolase [Candidatus Providencia siddallii]